MTYKIQTNGSTRSTHRDMSDARRAATKLNDADPRTEISIIENQTNKLKELWVGPVTFMPVDGNSMIAYSAADLDSIGAIRKAGNVWQAGNRGFEVGVYISLFDAAVGLHEHATSPAYVAA